MSKNEPKRNIRRTGRSIWLTVLILLICVMLTFILLSPLLSRLTKSDRNIIPLMYDGDREIFDKNGLSYIRVEEEPAVATFDKKTRWKTNTNVDLFKSAYANEKGIITVKSQNGDKIIAPGTSNEYEFYLKNTGNVSLDYTMLLGSVFSLEEHDLPILVRLRSGDRWILGGENNWVDPDSLSEIIESGTVDASKCITYVFEWQWPFENSAEGDGIIDNLNDTFIGDASSNKDVTFKLSIETQSVVTAGAVPVDGSGVELVNPLDLWNFLRRVLFPALILAGIILILLALLKRPVFVTGFIPATVGGEIKVGKKKSEIRPSGRFAFEKIYNGKRCFVSGEKKCPFKLKYKSRVQGVEFETKNDRLIITVGRKVRAIELYMYLNASEITVVQNNWAAIDKKRNVITPAGVKEPEDKQNTTPGGLHINKDGYFQILK